MIFDDVTNYYFWSVFVAWIVSVLIKILVDCFKYKKLCVFSGFRNGGMPSSHAALMSSITFALLLHKGLVPIFFLAFVITVLTIRDAVTVRREVGILGEKINSMMKKNEEKIRVIYGHTLIQVVVGLLIGILSATIFYFLL